MEWKKENYTWYFSGNNKGEREFRGVGIVVNNKILKNIKNIEAINERMIKVDIETTVPMTIIGVYAPHANRPKEEIEAFVGLLSCLRAPWLRQWNPLVLATDASKQGYAIATLASIIID